MGRLAVKGAGVEHAWYLGEKEHGYLVFRTILMKLLLLSSRLEVRTDAMESKGGQQGVEVDSAVV